MKRPPTWTGPFFFDCPHCRRPLHGTEEAIGQQGRCPRCGGDFTVPEPPSEEEEEEAPIPPSAWKPVSEGLTLTVFGIGVGVVVTAVLTAMALGMDQEFRDLRDLQSSTDTGLGGAALPAQALSPLLIAIGLLISLRAPAPPPLRVPATSSAVFTILGFLLGAVPSLLRAPWAALVLGEDTLGGIVLASGLLSLLATIVAQCAFVAFLGRIGLLLEDGKLQRSAQQYIALLCALVIGLLIAGGLAVFGLQHTWERVLLLVAVGLGAAIACLVLAIWWIVLVVRTFQALQKARRVARVYPKG